MKKKRCYWIFFYSDNCGGQNRNRFIFAMWKYASCILKVKITQRFLEIGHIQNEGDILQICIENSKKRKIIYVSFHWVTLVQCTKVTGQPHNVIEVSNQEFLNFKPIVQDTSYNWLSAANGSQIKEIMVTFENQFFFNIKYSLTLPDFNTINIRNKKQKR